MDTGRAPAPRRPPECDDLILDINIIKERRYLPKERARSTGGGNLVDEIADMSLDFVSLEAVARLGVGQAEIAADDEGAQPFAGQGDGLLDAEAAYDLHGHPVAHALENCTRHVVQVAALKQGRVGLPGVVLQVNADPVHAGGEHALRSLNRRYGRSLHGQEDISEGKPRNRWIGPSERVTHCAHRPSRRLACRGEGRPFLRYSVYI